MARPIWHGNISFGLVNIPVNLYTAEKPSSHVSFHLLDKKTHSRIHNQRVNERGQEVAWEDIEHGYEFEKGKYVIVDQTMLEKTAANTYETIEIEEFVPLVQIDPIFFEKPYYLLPQEAGIKGYTLLRDILQRSKKAGIAKVVIKTREYVAAILPQQEFLTMLLLRYANELHNLQEFADLMPESHSKVKISTREIELAEQLVQSMSGKWNPKEFHDENRELLIKLINTAVKRGETVQDKAKLKKAKGAHKAGADILDFKELLQKSVAAKSSKKNTRRKNNK